VAVTVIIKTPAMD